MHGSAGDVAAHAEGTWFLRGKSQSCRLARIGFDEDIIAVNIQAVNYIRADELNGHRIARVYLKL